MSIIELLLSSFLSRILDKQADVEYLFFENRPQKDRLLIFHKEGGDGYSLIMFIKCLALSFRLAEDNFFASF